MHSCFLLILSVAIRESNGGLIATISMLGIYVLTEIVKYKKKKKINVTEMTHMTAQPTLTEKRVLQRQNSVMKRFLSIN